MTITHSRRRTTIITALCSISLHMALLVLLTMQQMEYIKQQQAQLIFAESRPKQPNKTQAQPPQATPKPQQTVTVSGRTARQYAFDPSQIKALGLPYAPPSTLSSPDAKPTPSNSSSSPDSAPNTPSTPTPPTHATMNTLHPSTQSPTIDAIDPIDTQQNQAETPDISEPLKTEDPSHKAQQKPAAQKSSLTNTPPAQALATPTNIPSIPTHTETAAPKPSPKTAPSPHSQATQKPGANRTAQQKKPLTLAQLTSGFMAHLENKQSDSAITVIGKTSTAAPTTEQLVLERYYEKLVSCYERAHSIHNHKLNLKTAIPDGTTEILICYHTHNKTHTIHLLSSCGNKEVDDYYLFIMREASSSFPPAPRILCVDQTSFTTNFIVVSHSNSQTPSGRNNRPPYRR